MDNLLRRKEMAGKLADYLDEQIRLGFGWVVYNSDRPIGGSWDVVCYKDQATAGRDAAENQQIFDWHVSRPIGDLRADLKKIEYELKKKEYEQEFVGKLSG